MGTTTTTTTTPSPAPLVAGGKSPRTARVEQIADCLARLASRAVQAERHVRNAQCHAHAADARHSAGATAPDVGIEDDIRQALRQAVSDLDAAAAEVAIAAERLPALIPSSSDD